MFVVEHLKDHKPPSKIVEGLEPVRAIGETTYFVGLPYLMSLKKVLLEEAAEFTISLWRQVVFESIAYSEGFETEDMMVD
jgi:RNA-binding protein 25